ncbi:MAG: ATPase [Thermotogaceae bacterium]|nr:ATPase [Thermotogaceae bacterium]
MSTKLAALVSVLADKPLDESKKDWLVNREREVNYLKNVVSHLPFGILGVAGETGIGKTTVLNFVRPSNVFVLMVNISLRDTMESILYDLLYSISSKLEKDKDVGNYSKECKEWVSKEVATLKGFSLGVTLFANAGTKFEKSIAPRFNFFVAREKLGNLIKKAVQSKGKFVLIIDELDKEKKEDVLKVIDALKAQLLSENLIVIFSLPFAIYREYVADRMRWNEAGNLENVFKDIVFLEPMKPLEVKEMLIRRLKDYLELVDTEALELASDFSDGNPRDALWILSKSVYDNIGEKKLEKHHVLNTIRKVVNEYFSTGFSLTENQKKAINLLKDFKGPREKILKILQENGFKRTTAYSVLNQLIEKRFLIIREGNYKISGKFKFVDF